MLIKKINELFLGKYKDLIEEKELKINKLQNKLDDFDKMKYILQNKFNFIVPDYLIDEIIDSCSSNTYTNLYYLINCAVVNGTISKEDAKILKQAYPQY